jgi:hypothetical protein
LAARRRPVVEDRVKASRITKPARGPAEPQHRRAIIVAFKFTVGQIVDLKPNRFREAAKGQYEVRRLMPASDGDGAEPTYRIKNADEKHERVAFESELTLSDRPTPLFS